MSKTIIIELAEDRDKLREIYFPDRTRNAYHIGSLGSEYFEQTQSYWVLEQGAPAASVAVYSGLSAPAMFTWGSLEYVDLLLTRLFTKVPKRVLLHLYQEHAPAFEGKLEFASRHRVVRMSLTRENFKPMEPTAEIVPLGHADTADILRLYASYPDSFFEPYQLETGYYCGVREEGDLVSVGGIHFVSRSTRFAMIGNIVSMPSVRGKGYAQSCTSDLCSRLFDSADLLVLDVPADNARARTTFGRLGFEESFRYDQILARKISR